MASHGNQRPVWSIGLQNGADINYHKPDMVFPTFLDSLLPTEAARHNDFSMVRWLVNRVHTLPSRCVTGPTPWSTEQKSGNGRLLKKLAVEGIITNRKACRCYALNCLPSGGKSEAGPLRLEFPERELVKWAVTLHGFTGDDLETEKDVFLMAKMDNYSDYSPPWSPRDKVGIWTLSIRSFILLAKW